MGPGGYRPEGDGFASLRATCPRCRRLPLRRERQTPGREALDGRGGYFQRVAMPKDEAIRPIPMTTFQPPRSLMTGT